MPHDLQISTAECIIVQNILSSILPKTCKVWVFGSRARKNAKLKPYSDLDLAIELENAQILDLSLQGKLEVLFEESDLPWKVDVVDYNNVTAEFRAIIDKEKVALSPG